MLSDERIRKLALGSVTHPNAFVQTRLESVERAIRLAVAETAEACKAELAAERAARERAEKEMAVTRSCALSPNPFPNGMNDHMPEFFAMPEVTENLAKAHPVLIVRNCANEILRLRAELAAANEARQKAERERDEAAKVLPCGHPSALLVRSVESDYTACELCDCRQRRDDAERVETELRAEVERLRTAYAPLQKTLCVNVSCNHCKRSLLAVGCCDRKCDEAGQICGLRPLLTAVVPAIDAARVQQSKESQK